MRGVIVVNVSLKNIVVDYEIIKTYVFLSIENEFYYSLDLGESWKVVNK